MNWVIVTGNSKGLGLEITRSILEATSSGVIGISRSQNENIELLTKTYPDRYHHLVADLSQSEQISNLYLEKIKKIGKISGLVNNAASAYDDIATNANHEKLESMFKTNVLSPILLTKYAIRDMLLNDIKGSIIHISSVSAHTGYKGLSMYASTKGALEAYSKNIAREWGEKGIRSNCVCPGFMETEMSKKLSSEQKDKIYKRTSLKAETSIQSVARTVLFLLSEDAHSITGQVIHVDNGTI